MRKRFDVVGNRESNHVDNTSLFERILIWFGPYLIPIIMITVFIGLLLQVIYPWWVVMREREKEAKLEAVFLEAFNRGLASNGDADVVNSHVPEADVGAEIVAVNNRAVEE